jgi:integrase
MALNQALKWGMVHRNVATLVELRRASNTPIEPLTPTEAAQLLEAARGRGQEHLITAALGTGLRKGELLGLRWQDVDVDRGRLHVRQALEWRNGRPWRFVDPKSESGRRTIPLIGPAAAALRAQRLRVAEMRLAAEQWTDLDLVFPSELGTPIHPSNVNREFKKLLALAGLPTHHRVHNLRHSTATYLLAAGVNQRIVMQMMGWSQLSMLVRYQHVLDPMLDEAAERLERMFPQPGQRSS